MTSIMPMNRLLREYSGNWYLVLDGAAIKDVQRIVHKENSQTESVLLYYDTEYEQFCSISPCIISVNCDSRILDRFRNEKIFADAGVLFGFKGNLAAFKTALVPHMEARFNDGNIKLFRFYDPYVLQTLIDARALSLIHTVMGDAEYMAWFPNISCYNDEERTITVYKNPGGRYD